MSLSGKILLIWLIAANLLAFLLMGIDKAKAKGGKWRIRERTLFLFPLLGGGIGGCLGMWLFRHKTKHWYFALGFPVLALLYLAGFCWLMLR